MPADVPQACRSGTPDRVGRSSFGDSLQEAVADVDNLNLDARYKVCQPGRGQWGRRA